MEDKPLTFKELQASIDAWISQYEAGYWPPLANVARLAEEVGELAREINHTHGPKRKKSTEDAGSIAEELGDIVFTVAVIANSLGVDLTAVLTRTLEKVQTRDGDRWELKSEPSGDV